MAPWLTRVCMVRVFTALEMEAGPGREVIGRAFPPAPLIAASRTLDGGISSADMGSFQSYPRVDHYAQAFSPDGSFLYIGNDGGVWSTNTPSASTLTWNNLNASFSTVLFYPGL